MTQEAILDSPPPGVDSGDTLCTKDEEDWIDLTLATTDPSNPTERVEGEGMEKEEVKGDGMAGDGMAGDGMAGNGVEGESAVTILRSEF